MPKYEIRSDGMNGHRPVYTVGEKDVWDLLRYIDMFYGRIQHITLDLPSKGVVTINGNPVQFREVE